MPHLGGRLRFCHQSVLVLYWPMVVEVTPKGEPMSDLPAGRARMMTWNIWWRFGPRWQDRQHGLLETLRAVDADVVALQEVWGQRKQRKPTSSPASSGCTPHSRHRHIRRHLKRRGPQTTKE